MSCDVFLSHNSRDKPAVREIERALENAGFMAWLDESDLTPGKPWQADLEEALATARSIAVFIGVSGLGRWEEPEMRAALSEAVDRKVSVIPVLLPGGPEPGALPVFLKAYTYVDMRAGISESELYRLQCGIRGVAPRVRRTHQGDAIITGEADLTVVQASRVVPGVNQIPDASLRDLNPYMGVSAFHEEDADRFFGREEQIEELRNRFCDLHKVSPSEKPPLRVLAIYGPSGSGKTSVARAGLIPELARSPVPNLKSARVAVLTPGAHPLDSLASMLARIVTDDQIPVAKARELADEMRRKNGNGSHDGLRRIADAVPKIDDSPLILLLDQFEETYSLCEDAFERDAFVENLLVAASDRAKRVSVILTLRSDFLGETQNHQNLNSLISKQGYLVPAMHERQLRRAITQPAINSGYHFDDPTVDLLVTDTKDRIGALPLLQFALTRIWEGMAHGCPPSETLRKIGGAGGALAGEAQRLYDGLESDDKLIARRIFLGLVQLGEGTRDTRRRVKIQNLVPANSTLVDVESVIQRFCSPTARLVTLAANDEGEQTVEITHEALFDHWATFRTWLDHSRDDLRFLRRLDEAVRNWDNHGRPDGSLWRPPDLELLKEFHERKADEFTSLQMEFFDAAIKSENERLREEEMLREAQELRAINQDLDGKVDELARVNLQLYEINQTESNFLANVSYEMQTPLKSIIGFADVLLSNDTLTNRQKRFADNIRNTAHNLLEMINDIADLVKLERGKMEVRPGEFRVDELVTVQCDKVRSLAEEMNIDLELDAPVGFPPLYQDQSKVQRILHNLLSNAITHTPKGGRITVTARCNEQGQLELAVADTGFGVSEEDQYVVFEKFRHGTRIGEEYENSGVELGLSISKKLCVLMGGDINIESEFGKGSVFTVVLPWSV